MLVLAFIAQFSWLQSDVNSPDESILKQSKQNRARLSSTIKRPLSICIFEHAPMKGYSSPPLPHPPPHLRPLPSVCRGITAQRRHGRSMPHSCQFKQRGRALLYGVIYNTNRFSAGLRRRLFALFVLNLFLATAFGSYRLTQGRK